MQGETILLLQRRTPVHTNATAPKSSKNKRLVVCDSESPAMCLAWITTLVAGARLTTMTPSPRKAGPLGSWSR
jgi:hypothetical protein